MDVLVGKPYIYYKGNLTGLFLWLVISFSFGASINWIFILESESGVFVIAKLQFSAVI